MKLLLRMTLSLVSLLWLQILAATPRRLVFDKPVTIMTEPIAVAVDLVRDLYDRKSQTYRQESQGVKTHMCTLEITLEGRDWASQTEALSDHYFGHMDFTCDKSFEARRPAFKSHFSYMQVVGLENCFFTDTLRGDDFCNLAVIAYKTKLDLVSSQNTNLIVKADPKKDMREYYQIHSAVAQSTLQAYSLIPSGLNPADILSTQVFAMHLSRHTAAGAIPVLANQTLSNLRIGRLHGVHLPENLAASDAQALQELDALQMRLKELLQKVSSSPNPKSEVHEIAGDFFKIYRSHAETLLRVVLPSNFLRYRELQLELEHRYLSLVNEVSNADYQIDDFRREYGQTFKSYKQADTHLQRREMQPQAIGFFRSLYGDAFDPNPTIRTAWKNVSQRPSAQDLQTRYTRELFVNPAYYGADVVPQNTVLILKDDLMIPPRRRGTTLSLAGKCTLHITMAADVPVLVPKQTAFTVAKGQTENQRLDHSHIYRNSLLGVDIDSRPKNNYVGSSELLLEENPYFDRIFVVGEWEGPANFYVWLQACRGLFDIYYPN